jgi:predicted small secreted protein
MKKMKSLLLIAVFALTLALSSCYTMVHTVGDGARGGQTLQQKQWYALYGLVPINNVDSKSMAAGAENYTITTEITFIDYVITAFTSWVTIVVQTVEVQK